MVARFTECSIPKSSACSTSRRAVGGYPNRSATVVLDCAAATPAGCDGWASIPTIQSDAVVPSPPRLTIFFITCASHSLITLR